jgi:hypothetical protein
MILILLIFYFLGSVVVIGVIPLLAWINFLWLHWPDRSKFLLIAVAVILLGAVSTIIAAFIFEDFFLPSSYWERLLPLAVFGYPLALAILGCVAVIWNWIHRRRASENARLDR